ncbi:hypothetical protein MNBD_GAMMA07-2576 [hydrothermal vent metagenome]|uniref:DUF1415 domain-containing protein n=1 Tax=hydrothermal vent metagenome TaxID=652676 RepID=A0A3B0WLT9_9ZZZZ
MHSHQIIIQQTQYWLEHIIIGLNFCPFAKHEFQHQTIRYAVDNNTDLEATLMVLTKELEYLDHHPCTQQKSNDLNYTGTQTTLIIFTQAFSDFDAFLDLIELANHLIDDLGYSATYQLAHFHPQYCFDGVTADDASNYTNRSPYPILHLLREDGMQLAIERHPNTSQIPDANIALARKLGAVKIQKIIDKGMKIK